MDSNYTDGEQILLMEIANGNEDSFRRLFYKYQHKLSSYVFGWTKSTPVTEEIVQDIFLKIWVKRETLPAVNNFDGYLYILCRNQCFNALRQIASEKVKVQEWEKFSETSHEPEEDFLTEEFEGYIQEAIEQLTPQQKRVYDLKYNQKLKYKEVAELMDIAPETARKHMMAALKSIKNYLPKHLPVVLFLMISIRS